MHCHQYSLQLVRDRTIRFPGRGLSTIGRIAACARKLIGRSAHESLWVFCLDDCNKLVGVTQVGLGDTDSAVVYRRPILEFVLLSGTGRFALVHNHPFGLVRPSPEDLELVEDFEAAAKLLELTLVDSIIIGSAGYWSCKFGGFHFWLNR